MSQEKKKLDFGRLKMWWSNLQKQIADTPKSTSEKRSTALEEYFGTDEIALKEELTSAWEFSIVQLGNKLFPKLSRKSANSLAEKLSGIRFLNIPAVKKRHQVNLSFARYHSLSLIYWKVRSSISPFIWIFVFLVLSMISAYLFGTLSVFLGIDLGFRHTELDTVGIKFTVPADGEYFLLARSQSQNPNRYGLQAMSDDAEILLNNPPTGLVIPVNLGKYVFVTIGNGVTQNIYEVQATRGQTIYLEANLIYLDTEIKFQILNPDMTVCSNSIIVSNFNVGNQDATLTCTVNEDGAYYISISTMEPIQFDPSQATSLGHYGFFVFTWEREVEENEMADHASILRTGNYVVADVSIADQDWYRFVVNKGDILTIIAQPEDKASFSLILYEKSSGDLRPLAYGSSTVTYQSPVMKRFLATSNGRSVLYTALLRPLGLRPSYKWLMQNDMMILITFEMAALYFLFLLFLGLFTLDKFFSSRKFTNTRIVKEIVEILVQLDDETIINSEEKKGRFRAYVRDLAGLIPSLHSISRWPGSRTPRNVKTYFDGIAAQALETNEVISIPNKSTLDDLRDKYVLWLDLFMRGEYGSILAEGGSQAKKLPWYQPLLVFIKRNTGKGLLIGVVGFVALAVLSEQNPQAAEKLLGFLWLVVRYILLVGTVMMIYMQWGPNEADDSPASKWKNTARFVLFFLLPLIILDSLLKTGIVSTLATLISSIQVP